MKILFVTNLPSPYRVDFFNELTNYCELKVIYERKSSSERDSKWVNNDQRRFSEEYASLRPLGHDKSIGFDLIRIVKREKYDFLIISGYASPSVMLLIRYCKRRKIPYFIESDGGFNKTDKFFYRKIKRALICSAEGIFTTCREMEAYYKALGYHGKVYRVPFSSVFESEIFPAPSDKAEKESLRSRLGMTEEKIILSVGRFSYQNGYGKGYDCLLRAAEKMKSFPVGWYVLGGEPTEEFISMKERMGLSNVYFRPFKTKSELKEYYRAADIFVLMTVKDVWGLVINEAFSSGVPVITTDMCIAGREMITNGENGYLVSVGSDSELARKLKTLLSNDSLTRTISENNIQKAHGWTIETMAKAHIEVLKNL